MLENTPSVISSVPSDKELPVGQSQSGLTGQERPAEQENVRARTTSPSQGENIATFLPPSHVVICNSRKPAEVLGSPGSTGPPPSQAGSESDWSSELTDWSLQ